MSRMERGRRLSLYNPVWTSALSTSVDFVFATVAFVLLLAWRAPPLAVVVPRAAGGAAPR